MPPPPAGPELTRTERGVLDALADLATLIALPIGARVTARVARQGDHLQTHISRPFVAAAFENALAAKGITDFALPRAGTLQLFRDALEQSYLEVPTVPGLDVAYQALCNAMGAYAAGAGIAEGQSIAMTVERAVGTLEITVTWPYRTERPLFGPPTAEELTMPAFKALIPFPR